MHADVFHPSMLSEADAQAWREMCAATPAFANPLLGPEFARLAGEVREDARVALFRDGRALLGVLAYHHRPSGFARPIGAAFSDYHALITPPDAPLDGDAALAVAGVNAFRFTALIDPYGCFSGASHPSQSGHVVAAGADPEGYLQCLKQANAKRFKNLKRLRSKLEREHGALGVVACDTSQEAFDQLLAWKREQYHRTGAHDVCRPDWARQMLQRTFERRSGNLRGVMTTLYAGGRPVAGLFGPAVGSAWHGWVSAFDPACAPAGPGLVLMLELPFAMREAGLASCDMAPSHDHYKGAFATDQVEVGEGLSLAQTPAGRCRASLEAALALAGSERVVALTRLRRRLDQIATVEISMSGRVRGVVDALVGYGRRNAFRKTCEEVAARDAA